MTDWLIVLDDKGKFKEFTDNAKVLGAALSVIAAVLATKMIINIGKFVSSLWQIAKPINLIVLGIGLLLTHITFLANRLKSGHTEKHAHSSYDNLPMPGGAFQAAGRICPAARD
jgi:hypothetical protein